MAVIKNRPLNPNAGMVTTTMGMRDRRSERCRRCGQFPDDLMTVNQNGQIVCSNCASPKERVILTQCDSENCPCGEKIDGEPDPA